MVSCLQWHLVQTAHVALHESILTFAFESSLCKDDLHNTPVNAATLRTHPAAALWAALLWVLGGQFRAPAHASAFNPYC